MLLEKKGSGLAREAECPLVACKRGSDGSMGSEGSEGVVRRIKTGKRRGILIVLRAIVISSVALALPCRTVSSLIALFQSPFAFNPQSLVTRGS